MRDVSEHIGWQFHFSQCNNHNMFEILQSHSVAMFSRKGVKCIPIAFGIREDFDLTHNIHIDSPENYIAFFPSRSGTELDGVFIDTYLHIWAENQAHSLAEHHVLHALIPDRLWVPLLLLNQPVNSYTCCLLNRTTLLQRHLR